MRESFVFESGEKFGPFEGEVEKDFLPECQAMKMLGELLDKNPNLGDSDSEESKKVYQMLRFMADESYIFVYRLECRKERRCMF